MSDYEQIPYEAKIIADSVSPTKKRLTTMTITLPKCILAEFNTHRMLSRNSASSRAIPIKKTIERVQNNPYVPLSFGKNQAGMQAGAEMDVESQAAALKQWLVARDAAVTSASVLSEIGLHKQHANRLLEPFVWTTIVCTATEWDNFFALRISPLAQPEICKAATNMYEAMQASTPRLIDCDQWHIPFISDEEMTSLNDPVFWRKVSVARCARVSYLTHEGIRDPHKDFQLAEKLENSGHWSPYEHIAYPLREASVKSGNFIGWHQYRKDFNNENTWSFQLNHAM